LRRDRRKTVEQLRFEWVGPTEAREPNEVVLDPETTKAAIALMASALVAVVRAAEEPDDER
jgi:hypothetical protein